jgi:signal transduction histidine kinase
METSPLILDPNPPFIAPAAETREKLLSAAARASRLLLESTDAMQVMPDVLRLLGEAAEVHRTALALAEVDAGGERWLVIKDEWVSEELMECTGETCGIEPDQYSDIYCSMLQTGKSVLYCRDTMPEHEAVSITSDRARSSAIVPILVDGEYVGVIGFDDWRRARQFDSSIVSALEIAAGLVGAALYRERLLDTMRREREQLAEERVSQLDRANATLRANLNRLAGNPDVRDFIANMLIDASRQVDAAASFAAGIDQDANVWRIFMYVENGAIVDPPFPATVPTDKNPDLASLLEKNHEPVFYNLDTLEKPLWPESVEWHRQNGHHSAYLLPLVFGGRNVGFLTLVFKEREPLSLEQMQVLLALSHQATLAIGMKKLGIAAKEAAVLAERNRIGQEIHDGLAQGFTGILMQLGAAEEAMVGCAKNSPLPDILKRCRDLAKDGLAEARRSVGALRPDQTRRVGLELALRQLAERSHLPGRINFSFEGGMQGEGLVPERQHELLRIAQEAVSNAVRHAHPTNVHITLHEEDAQWQLLVVDDGRGMTLMPELYASQGYGLNNMRERATAIGGKFEIDSKPGVGTRIVVSLPRPAARTT